MSVFSVIFSLLFVPFQSLAQPDQWETHETPRSPASTAGYICQIDSECLDHLYNTILNEQSSESIYQVCKEAHKRSKDCCLNPTNCNGMPYAQSSHQLKEDSFSFFQQHGGNTTSCQLNNLSSLMSGLSQMQNNFCSNGKTFCKRTCENRLEDLKRAFRDCFSISETYTINHILEKSQNPSSHHDCYKEIRNVAEIYKRHSRNQTALFENHLESQDIVDCASIGREKPASNLNSLAVNICQQAQQKRQEVEAKQKQEQITPQETTAKTEPKMGAGSLSSSPGSRQSGGGTEGLGSGALLGAAGVAAGALALQKNSNKGKSSSRENMSRAAVNNNQRVFPGKNKNRHTIPLKKQKSKNGIDRQRENMSDRRVSRTNILTGSELKTSSDTNLQLAQANTGSRNCPISMPYIGSAIVFQSVEAPQIEPMNEQASIPYDNYDLVMGKQAGVLVKLDRRRMDSRKEFSIDLTISEENKYRNKCFHEPMKREMREGQEDFCFFTIGDLRKDGDYKFFPLPMHENLLNRNGVTRSVKLTLYPRGYANNSSCHEKKSFKMKVIETHNLKLGFTRIDGGRNCRASSNRNTGYDMVSYNKVMGFTNSDEVSRNIPSMFPVTKVVSYALRYTWKGKSLDYVDGHCNNTFAKERPKHTIGLLSDVVQLEYVRASLGYHKLIAIVPESYFTFHRGIRGTDHDSVGFIISPRWNKELWFAFWEWKSGFLGGSWNIAFVHEEELDKGTVAHELAHTVGQGKEFYKSNERCQQFRGKPLEGCKDYQIPRVLNAWTVRGFQRWKFLKNKI